VSLKAYGVETPDVVREPVEDHHDAELVACPECGQPVGEPTTRKVSWPDIVDDVHPSPFITRAYRCTRHAYDVLLPVRVADGAPSLGDDWTTVRVQYADERIRHVAVPKTVVTET
jgi:hypothetical protein